MKPLKVHPAAQDELTDAMEWYEERQEGLGCDLHSEVNAALAKIEADPGVGARHENTGFRFYRVKRYPYFIYYIEQESIVWVAAIAHGRRRPNYWRRRKPS